MNRNGDGLRLALVRPAIVALSRALPYVPDRLLLRFVYRSVSTVPYPDGRDFLARMFYVAKEVLSTRSVNCRNKVIYNFLNILRQVVAKCGAHATHPGGETVITELKEALDDYARRYGEIADKVWQEEYLTDGKRLYTDLPSTDEATRRLQEAEARFGRACDSHE